MVWTFDRLKALIDEHKTGKFTVQELMNKHGTGNTGQFYQLRARYERSLGEQTMSNEKPRDAKVHTFIAEFENAIKSRDTAIRTRDDKIKDMATRISFLESAAGRSAPVIDPEEEKRQKRIALLLKQRDDFDRELKELSAKK